MKHKNSYNRKTIAYAKILSYDQKDDSDLGLLLAVP